MIILTEVAKTLETILNGYQGFDYQFMVATEGFHIDTLADTKTGKNFIPVFISSLGGQINPVPGLKQAQYNIKVEMFYPVRFKDDFFALNDKLFDSFVGISRSYGTISGVALSNISIAQYGELQNLDFNQFKDWVGNTYSKTVDVMETYMKMEFVLYLSTLASGLAFGNEVTTTLKATIDGVEYTENDPVFDEGSIQSQSEADGQQVLDDTESTEIEGAIQTTSYGSGFKLYLKNTTFYTKLIEKYFAGEIQKTDIEVSYTLLGKTYTRKCYVKSTNLLFPKGQPIYMVFAFGKKVEIE